MKKNNKTQKHITTKKNYEELLLITVSFRLPIFAIEETLVYVKELIRCFTRQKGIQICLLLWQKLLFESKQR